MTDEGPHAQDVALARACVGGDAAALREFEARLGPEIDVALTRLGLDHDEAGDVKSRVLEKLLARPSIKLDQYA